MSLQSGFQSITSTLLPFLFIDFPPMLGLAPSCFVAVWGILPGLFFIIPNKNGLFVVLPSKLNFFARRVSALFRGVVLSVDRDGLSSVTYRVKLHDLLFCSVPVPSGAKWIGGKLSIYGRPVLSAGQSVIVKGVFTKRLSKYYIDPASISFY